MTDTEETEIDSTSLPANYAPLALEKEIREFWVKNQIREKLELVEKDEKAS